MSSRAAERSRRSVALGLCACLAVLLAGSSPMATAQGLSFLKDAPAKHFSKEDRDLMTKNLNEVLESAAPDASGEWTNPKTGNSGRAEIRSQFTATDGAPCKSVRVYNKVKRGNIEGDSIQTLCKYPDRGWLLHPDAVPMSSPAK